MKVVVMFNPVSGTGRSQATAQGLADRLNAAGHVATLAPSQRTLDTRWLDEALKDAGAMIVAGGDGAVRLAAEPCARLNVPMYHLPCGTENLFAREFGMTADAEMIIAAINAMRINRVDLCEVNGVSFVLMCSVGFDAEVVHHLAVTRGKSISHRSYIWPIVRQFLGWSPPPMTIEVDGGPLVNGVRGIVIVANSRQYAWRMDPARPAEMDDGLMDVVFMPMRTRVGLLWWSLKCFRGNHMKHARLVHARATSVRVRLEQRAHNQVDGDPGPLDAQELTMTIRKAALPVLMPVCGERNHK